MHEIPVVDPDQIAEILVAGPFNFTVNNSFATLTLTHLRPHAASVMSTPAEVKMEAVVRARLVIPIDGLRSLRDSLDQLLRGLEAESSSAISLGGH